MHGDGRTRWGYHRLTERSARQLVTDAGVGPRDLVLEIGAGTGVITAQLLAAARWWLPSSCIQPGPGRSGTVSAPMSWWCRPMRRTYDPRQPFRVVATSLLRVGGCAPMAHRPREPSDLGGPRRADVHHCSLGGWARSGVDPLVPHVPSPGGPPAPSEMAGLTRTLQELGGQLRLELGDPAPGPPELGGLARRGARQFPAVDLVLAHPPLHRELEDLDLGYPAPRSDLLDDHRPELRGMGAWHGFLPVVEAASLTRAVQKLAARSWFNYRGPVTIVATHPSQSLPSRRCGGIGTWRPRPIPK